MSYVSNALPAGRWITRRGVRIFVPDPVDYSALIERYGGHPGDHFAADEALVWDRIARNLADDGFVDDSPVTGALCGACGCLLSPTDHWCPGCLDWAQRDAVRASWLADVIPFTPTITERTAA